MRVVLDTNVFVSCVFFAGPPYQILKAWHEGKLRLVVSPEILEEYQRVGAALAKNFAGIDIGKLLDMVAMRAEVVHARTLPGHICADPDDDKFLAAALAGRCKLIVSGDKHLLQVSGFRKVRVLTPRNFVDEMLSSR